MKRAFGQNPKYVIFLQSLYIIDYFLTDAII